MELHQKKMYFANFNITFGEYSEPMLNYFVDVILPTFNSGLYRGREDQFPRYSFEDVKIAKLNDGELYLVGNYIKDDEIDRFTTRKAGKLISDFTLVPTSPFSRFIIFLKNHKMILIKNQSSSPDIRSFQSTMRTVIGRFIGRENKKRKLNNLPLLPAADVNIVDMVLPDSIENFMQNIDKIDYLRLNFFPLNNESDDSPATEAIRRAMADLRADRSNWTIPSPKSISEVTHLVAHTTESGLAVATIEGVDIYGSPVTVKEGTFRSSIEVLKEGDLHPSDDEYFISQAMKNRAIGKVGDENKSLYKKFFAQLESMITPGN